jgi:cbb3-type cytochrome oxidase maturation protein
MSVIIVLISASLLIAAGFLTAFFWSVKSGQYQDDYTPSVRILFDNDKNISEKNETTNSETTDL